MNDLNLTVINTLSESVLVISHPLLGCKSEEYDPDGYSISRTFIANNIIYDRTNELQVFLNSQADLNGKNVSTTLPLIELILKEHFDIQYDNSGVREKDIFNTMYSIKSPTITMKYLFGYSSVPNTVYEQNNTYYIKTLDNFYRPLYKSDNEIVISSKTIPASLLDENNIREIPRLIIPEERFGSFKELYNSYNLFKI